MFRAFYLALVKLALFVLGLVVVPVLLPFRSTDGSTLLPSGWVFSNIPGWWGNPFDGLYGDKRGDWADMCQQAGRDPQGYLSMFLWAAVRNPVNYWSRMVAGCDVSRCVITKAWGDDEVIEEPDLGGVQYLLATRDDGVQYPRFFAVLPWPFRPDRALMIDIGWKIKLSHNGTPTDAHPKDRFKGLVFTASPWKTLE